MPPKKKVASVSTKSAGKSTEMSKTAGTMAHLIYLCSYKDCRAISSSMIIPCEVYDVNINIVPLTITAKGEKASGSPKTSLDVALVRKVNPCRL